MTTPSRTDESRKLTFPYKWAVVHAKLSGPSDRVFLKIKRDDYKVWYGPVPLYEGQLEDWRKVITAVATSIVDNHHYTKELERTGGDRDEL